MNNDIIILIHSYRPDLKLVTLIQDLRFLSGLPIVIVDDGNKGEVFQKILFDLTRTKNVHLVHHSHNRGKGAALKTGLHYILQHFPNALGVVTADADGQHHPKDILKIAEQLSREPGHFILGMRDFRANDVPFRSRFGNQITSKIFKLATGVTCPDTQTGLRGLSISAIQIALETKGNRFEYEMNQLLEIARRKIPFTNLPIETIYIENNASSHYNPLLDSLKILGAILKFVLVSCLGGTLDIMLFFILTSLFFTDDIKGVILASILARIGSGLVNYLLNAKWVFASRPDSQSAKRYIWLFIGLLTTSSLMVAGLSHWLGHQLTIKILVDALLFIVSYKLQQDYVFHLDTEEGELPNPTSTMLS